MDHRRIQDF